MGSDSSGDLVVTEVKWEEKPGNSWLLRQVFDLLLRNPQNLTDEDMPPTMPLETVAEKKGGEQ